MTNVHDFSDEELISYVYDTSVEEDKPSEISDWNTWHQWMDSTHQLSPLAQMAYRITKLNNQVINGGFIQYFDNLYGIFVYETLEDLEKIGAVKVRQLLSDSLKFMNPNNYTGDMYFEHIYNRALEEYTGPDDEFHLLDITYYELDEQSDPIPLLAKYLRKQLSL